MNLNKNDYNILDTLYRNQCVTKICSFTKQRIANECKLSVFKITASLKIFINMGLVDEGAKDERAKTYYLTENGVKLIEDIREENAIIFEIKKKMEE